MFKYIQLLLLAYLITVLKQANRKIPQPNDDYSRRVLVVYIILKILVVYIIKKNQNHDFL